MEEPVLEDVFLYAVFRAYRGITSSVIAASTDHR
jgi:hypothetical protein